jgi:hypothetical protein
MAKVAKIWDGTAWVDLATSVPDLSNYQLKSEGGLTLVKKQTIGTGVASVTVNDAFSATYDNYRIIMTGGVGSSNNDTTFTLGSTTTGYNYTGIYNSYSSATVLGLTLANQASVRYFGWAGTANMEMDLDIKNPYLARITNFKGGMNETSGGLTMNMIGYLNNTTSYTSITLTPSAGTLTGGAVYVYGYNKG